MNLLQRSFAAGEITEELSGHVESREYQTGLKRCRNFITLPHGPAMLRPGLLHEQFGFDADHAARLIPFVPDQDSAFLVAIVAGKGYVLAGDGLGTVVGAGSSMAYVAHPTDPNPFHLYVATGAPQPSGFVRFQTVQEIYAPSPPMHQNPPALSNQWWRVEYSHDTGGGTHKVYKLFHPSMGPMRAELFAPYTTARPVAYDNAIELTLPYAAADLPNIHYAQSYDVLTLTCAGHAPRTIRYSSISGWSVTEEIVGAYILEPPLGVATPSTGGSAGSSPTQQVFMAWLFYRSHGEWIPMDRSLFFTTTVDPVDGAITFGAAGALTADHKVVLYRLENGIFYKTAERIGPGAATASVGLGALERNEPAPGSRFNFGANDFRAVAYFQQRKVYGGMSPAPTAGVGPQTLLLTRPGTEQDVSYHTPTEPDDAISLTVAALRRNQVEHLVPINSAVLALTGGGVFSLAGGPEGLSADSFSVDPKSYHGANTAVPAVSGDAVFYGAARGGNVYVVRYSQEQGGTVVRNASLLAPHLFEGRTVRSLAVQESPYKILWIVLDDYSLLSCTFDFDLQVLAWHKHVTEGEVHYVATLPSAVEDHVYATVRRPAPTYPASFFAIERLDSLLDDDRTTAVRLDRAHIYAGAAADEITGLAALEGLTVRVVGDGADMGEFGVVNGAITLPHDVTYAIVGVPYQGHLETLPLAIEARGVGAYGQGRSKNVNGVHLRMKNSAVVKVGQNDTDLRELAPYMPYALGDLPPLLNGLYELSIDPEWRDDTTLHVVADEAFPVKIMSMAIDVEVSDG